MEGRSDASSNNINNDNNNNNEGSNTDVTEDQPPAASGDANAIQGNVSHANLTASATFQPQAEATSFDALTNMLHWKRGSLFCRSNALALIPTTQDTNPIFRDLLGDELGSHVPFAIELLQGILSIASHDCGNNLTRHRSLSEKKKHRSDT